MNEKLLILEATWAEEDDNYLLDSRSASQVYGSLEKLLSASEHPLTIIQRPLLKCRFARDIRQFVNLDANRKGLNVIILSAHGHMTKGKKMRRELCAIDGQLNISAEIRTLKSILDRTIIILDSCGVGENIRSFQKASGTLGVIGFAKDVDWIDSAVFILAMLCHFHDRGVFLMQRKSPVRPRKVLEDLKEGVYGPFFEALGVDYHFSDC